MSLNSIELSDPMIAELYGDLLVRTAAASQQDDAATEPNPTPPATLPIPPAPRYKFLGDNKKKITILVDSPEAVFLPDDQLAFLTKMLEACKMNIGDVAIVNHAAAPVDIATLKQQLTPAILLLFGPGPGEIQLPLHFPPFRIQAYDHCTYLCVPSLAQLVQPGDESKLLKSKLWVCLKALFEI